MFTPLHTIYYTMHSGGWPVHLGCPQIDDNTNSRFREHSTKQTCLDLIPLALSLAKTAGAPMSPPAKSRAPSAFQQRLLEVTVRGTVQQCSAFKRILKPP